MNCRSIQEIHGCVPFRQCQSLLRWPLNSCLALPTFEKSSTCPAGHTQQLIQSLRELRSSLQVTEPSHLCSILLLFYSSPSLHKFHPEWNGSFCVEERLHRAYLPSCCSFCCHFSPQTLPGLHRPRAEMAGKRCLRLVFLSTPFPVSPHFLCVVYCIWGQRFFFFCTVQIIQC